MDYCTLTLQLGVTTADLQGCLRPGSEPAQPSLQVQSILCRPTARIFQDMGGAHEEGFVISTWRMLFNVAGTGPFVPVDPWKIPPFQAKT